MISKIKKTLSKKNRLKAKKQQLCDRAVAILNAGYKTNIVTNDDLKTIHVNDKNMYRFINKHDIRFISKFPQYYYATIREAKAKALFWKFLYHYVELLWE